MFANLLNDDFAEVLNEELLVLNKIPESKVTFTACKPLLSVTCSTSAPCMGESNPVADNSTEAGRKENRRVEVYMYASQEMIQQAEAGTLK